MFVSFILALLLVPPALYLYICLKVLRTSGKILFHWIYPDLRLVSSDSLRCTLDTRRNPSVVTMLLTLQGNISVAELRQRILTEIVQKRKNGQRAVPKFPHLKMLLTTKLGCQVWKTDDQFDIANHVTMADVRWKGRPISEANLQSFISEQCCRPLPKRMSPWQVLLINLQSTDLKLDTVVVLIRIHHLVSEGLSLNHIFQRTLSGQIPLPPLSPPPQTFQAIPESYSVFAKRSATKQTFRQILDKTQLTIRSVRSKCDPSDPRDDLTAVWCYIRKVLKGFQDFFVEMHKLYELTDPQDVGRSAWFRAGSLIYFLPRLLASLEWLWTFSFLELWKQMALGLLRLPKWSIQLTWIVAQTLVTEVRLFIRSSRPIYIMLKDSSREIWETLQTIFRAPSLILTEFLQRSDQYPLLRHSGSGRKTVAWSEPLPLDVVQRVKSACGATTNEVLVSLCAGSLTRYFRVMGLDVPDNIMTTLPVYSEDFTEACESGGDGFVTLSLPTGDIDAVSRLVTTQRRMGRIRASPSKYLVSMALLRYLQNFLPDFVVGIIVKFLSRQYLMILANVAINPASVPLVAWGRDVRSICYWRPPQANTALSLSLITYNDQVTMMAMSNQDIVPQPQIITDQFVKEFNGLACTMGIRRERQSLRNPLSSPYTSSF